MRNHSAFAVLGNTSLQKQAIFDGLGQTMKGWGNSISAGVQGALQSTKSNLAGAGALVTGKGFQGAADAANQSWNNSRKNLAATQNRAQAHHATANAMAEKNQASFARPVNTAFGAAKGLWNGGFNGMAAGANDSWNKGTAVINDQNKIIADSQKAIGANSPGANGMAAPPAAPKPPTPGVIPGGSAPNPTSPGGAVSTINPPPSMKSRMPMNGSGQAFPTQAQPLPPATSTPPGHGFNPLPSPPQQPTPVQEIYKGAFAHLEKMAYANYQNMGHQGAQSANQTPTPAAAPSVMPIVNAARDGVGMGINAVGDVANAGAGALGHGVKTMTQAAPGVLGQLAAAPLSLVPGAGGLSAAVRDTTQSGLQPGANAMGDAAQRGIERGGRAAHDGLANVANAVAPGPMAKSLQIPGLGIPRAHIVPGDTGPPAAAPAAAPSGPTPEQIAAFRKQTGTRFNSKSKMDLQNMQRLIGGQETMNAQQYRSKSAFAALEKGAAPGGLAGFASKGLAWGAGKLKTVADVGRNAYQKANTKGVVKSLTANTKQTQRELEAAYGTARATGRGGAARGAAAMDQARATGLARGEDIMAAHVKATNAAGGMAGRFEGMANKANNALTNSKALQHGVNYAAPAALAGAGLYGANRMGHSSGMAEGVNQGVDAGMQAGVNAAAQQGQQEQPGYLGGLWNAVSGKPSGGFNVGQTYEQLGGQRQQLVNQLMGGRV